MRVTHTGRRSRRHPEGKDGARDGLLHVRRRSLAARLVASVAAAALMFAVAGTTVAGAQGSPSASLTPVAQVDIGSFSARADAWVTARSEMRLATLQQAQELAEQGKAAEEAAIEAATRLAEAELAREAAAEAERLAAEEAARVAAEEAARKAATTTTTAAPAPVAPPTTTAAPSAPPPVGGPSAAQWAALRQCESSGNYAAVNPNGRYRGAYQFSQATWDWVAGINDPSLIGIDPAAATPAQQDSQAYALYALRGSSPWPHCGVHLR